MQDMCEGLKEILVVTDAKLSHLPLDEIEELCQDSNAGDDRLWPSSLKAFYLHSDPELKRSMHLLVESHYGKLMRGIAGEDFWRLSALAYTRVIPLRLAYEESMGHRRDDALFVASAVEAAYPARPRGSIRILDIGCGTGELLAHLASSGFGPLEGIDVSRAAVTKAMERLSGTGTELKCMSLRRLLGDGPSGTYDAVALCDVVEHLPHADVPGILRSLRRLLSPGGVLILVTPSAISGPHDLEFLPQGYPRTGLHLHEYRLAELRAALRLAGYTALRSCFLAHSEGWSGTLSGGAFWIKYALEPLIALAPFPLGVRLTEGLYFRGVACRAT